MTAIIFFLYLNILSIKPFLYANAALVAVYSLQRHGARNVLPKGAFLTEDALVGGPTLLPQGQLQTYNAGVAFQNRYLNGTTCGATGTCLFGLGNGTKYGVLNQANVGYGNFDVYVRSSALDRTILSAQCFFNGVFPPDPTAPTNTSYMPTGAQVVPIYTQADTEDILIRAYTKCNTYQSNLQSWFRSQEFETKTNETELLRKRVKDMVPYMNTSLANWWNVYDAINVYQTYGVGNLVPRFDQDLFMQIQDLAYWLETSKMRSSLTGNLLGGVVLADLSDYFKLAATAASNGSQAYYKLLSLSGHYNTQLGLIAALELDKLPNAQNFTWFRSLPKLAAVMVFELHAVDAAAVTLPADTGASYYVRLMYQDGPQAWYGTIPLPCATSAASVALGPGACTLYDFLSYTSRGAFTTAQAWCTACNNSEVAACAVAQLAEVKAAMARGSGKGTETEAWKIAVSVVVTFVGTVLLATVVAWIWYWRLRRQWRQYGAGPAPGAAAVSLGSDGKLEAQMAEYQAAPGHTI